jgi:DNA-binding NtrC family response regulator
MEQNLRESAPQSTTGVPSPAFFEAVSPNMRGVEEVIRELAHSSVPVLLIGERGVGKRTIAKRIHGNSSGPEEGFLTVSCEELTPEAFSTSAPESGNTLYLEEIGELSPTSQQALLDFLSRQTDHGAGHDGARVICGSSRDLESDVRSKGFREDLYYRLSGVCLRIPPVRQRKEDIPLLIDFFLIRYSQSFRCAVPPLSAETQRLFLEYSWPGNLSEMDSVARAIVAVGDESVAMGGLRSVLMTHSKSNGEKVSLKDAARAASREAERELILRVLTKTRWNRRRAAQELQISYKALLYKLKQIGCEEYGAT